MSSLSFGANALEKYKQFFKNLSNLDTNQTTEINLGRTVKDLLLSADSLSFRILLLLDLNTAFDITS